ncbi:MAG TPA: phosphatase PAP2 family protein [Phycisphaerales bacterium]|nr:phosphatase PAP2 family protein [Phycisphaerales bacterium]
MSVPHSVPAALLAPHERRARRVRGLVVALALVVGLLLVTLIDRWVWERFTLDRATFESVERKDWYQLFRQVGYLPAWFIAAVFMWWAEGKLRRASMVFLAAALGGAAAEVLKGVVQRFRPGTNGEYVFRWVMDEVPGGELVRGLGLASSHAGVAFGGAMMVAALWPRVGAVAVALAVGCCVTRLISGAHFLSDVYVAGVLSYGVVRGLLAVDGRRAG